MLIKAPVFGRFPLAPFGSRNPLKTITSYQLQTLRQAYVYTDKTHSLSKIVSTNPFFPCIKTTFEPACLIKILAILPTQCRSKNHADQIIRSSFVEVAIIALSQELMIYLSLSSFNPNPNVFAPSREYFFGNSTCRTPTN